MTVVEVQKIAEDFLAQENLKGWGYDLEEPVPDSKCKGEWNVQVKWTSPEGVPIDGPGVIIICEETRAARFFE